MKKKRLVFPILIFVALFIWWVIHQKNGQTVEEPGDNLDQTISEPPQQSDNAETSTNRTSNDPPKIHEEFMARYEQRLRERAEAEERGRDEWRAPIEFYGKVVDENEMPVAEAKIQFSANDLSMEGTSYYQAISDSEGLFSIAGIKGKLLVVRITKEGYYTSKRDNISFEYGDPYNHFIPCHGSLQNQPPRVESKPASLRWVIHISFCDFIKRFRRRDRTSRERAGALEPV